MRKKQSKKPLEIDPKDALELGRCMHKFAHALDGAMFTRAEALSLFGFLDELMYMLMQEHKEDLRHLQIWADWYDGQYEAFVDKEPPTEVDDD